MISEPLVSVIIPTYQSARTLQSCIQSVQAQTYPNIEILVVDNSSTDGAREIAESCGARVIVCGPERSAQVNAGARAAAGEFVYRIDGDFVLDPEIVSACVALLQSGTCDAVVTPNRSTGDGWWARVRALERDTYLGDDLMVAARFLRRSFFLELGGLDESLNACEDLDFHLRLQQRGYRTGHLMPGVHGGELHLGEAGRLSDYARESFYYGPSIARYLYKNPARGLRQAIPVRPSFIRHAGSFMRQPHLALGLIVLKITQYLFAGLGMLASALALTRGRAQLSQEMIYLLVFVLAAGMGAAGLLEKWGLAAASNSLLAVPASLLLWQWAGRAASKRLAMPVQAALRRNALAFLPLAALILPGIWAYPLLVTLFCAAFAAALVWAAGFTAAAPSVPRAASGRASALAVALVALAAAGWVGVQLWYLQAQLSNFDAARLGAVITDQALWNAAHPAAGSGGIHAEGWFYSSIKGGSLFADTTGPLLAVLTPFYAAGWGGSLLLFGIQWASLAGAALLLYFLARPAGALAATLAALAHLVYLTALRAPAGDFTPLALAGPFLLLALLALEKRRWGVYVLMLLLALLCGVEISWAAAPLGLTLLLRRDTRRAGWLTLGLAGAWMWASLGALIPLLGGGQPYWSDLNRLGHVMRPQAGLFLLAVLAPLGFLSLLGPLAGLRSSLQPDAGSNRAPQAFAMGGMAWPLLLLTALGDQLPRGLEGWFGPILAPLLALSVIDALRAYPTLKYAICALALAGSLATGFSQAAFRFEALPTAENAHFAIGRQILAQIPQDAAVATQIPYAGALAHRRQLTILPTVGTAEYLLFDALHPNRLPYPDQYAQLLRQAFHNPDFQLQSATGGYLLFARGAQQPGENAARLALVVDPKIRYPRQVRLGNEAAFLGFDVSQTTVLPGETLYLTYYWKCLAPLSRPYLLFTASPGERRFEEFAFGLYPPALWQPGQVIHQEQAITLPALPDGDDYELVVGLWYDPGSLELTSAEQLLGKDVVRVARLRAHRGRIELAPWTDAAGDQP